MTVSYDGNIVVAGTIIKLKNDATRIILKNYLQDCNFLAYKITKDYIKLVFNSFELRKAIQQLSASDEDYIVKDNTIFIRLHENAVIDELDEGNPEGNPENNSESDSKDTPTKEKEVKEVKDSAPIELVIAPGDVIKELAPGEYKIIFNGITFAILSQGDDRNYIKTEKVITITDQFKKLTGVSTKKKNK